jgi:3-hydroxyacyl-CoA dehydrogenase/enoyl-CoA hydratase/3-hydroxybutyryl-CoA epimerase
LKASAVLHDAFGDRMRPMEGLGIMTDQGRLGRKSGRGFYDYSRRRKKIDPVVYEMIGASTDASVNPNDIRLRLVYSLLNEATRALNENVVRSVRDADIGAIFGMGFPPFLGGPLRYLDTVGAGAAVSTLEGLVMKYGNRFEPAEILKTMADAGRHYYNNP